MANTTPIQGNAPGWITPPAKRFNLATLVFPMTSAVTFGFGIVAILMNATLTANAFVTIPAMIALSFAAGAIAAWVIAPRLRARVPRDALS